MFTNGIRMPGNPPAALCVGGSGPRRSDRLTARFMQVDPIGYDDHINLYGYVGNDPINKVDPTGQYECATTKDCDAAKAGIKEIKAARDFYASSETGSRLARSPSAARALDKTLSSLGKEGDGGVNIRAGIIDGKARGLYQQSSNTITLDLQRIEKTGARIGEVLGHETQHYRQRHERLSPLAGEVRPLGIQYIIGIAPGGSIPSMTGRHYLQDRLSGPGGYCRVTIRFCGPATERVMQDELHKPF